MSAESTIIDARPRLGGLGWFLFGLAGLIALSTVPFAIHSPGPAFGVVGAVVSMLTLPAALAAAAWRSRRWFVAARQRTLRGRVTADRTGVAVDGETVVLRADIAAGLVQAAPPAVRLLLGSGGFVEVAANSVEGARATLRDMGLGPEERALTIPINVAARRGALAVGPIFAALFSLDAYRVATAFGLVVSAAMLAASAVWAWRTLAKPASVDVGVDALVVHTSLRRDRAIPLGRVRSIEVVGTDVVLSLDDGRRETIGCGAGEVELVAERVQEALEARGTGQGAVGEALLARGGRPVSAWIGALRAILATGEGGYRDVVVDAPALLRVVEDARATDEARAAAAVAVAPSLDTDGRTRLRVAAEAVVRPKLRVALAAAADGEQDAIEEALAELADEDEREGARA